MNEPPRTANPAYPKWVIGALVAITSFLLLVFTLDGGEPHGDTLVAPTEGTETTARLGDSVSDGNLTFTIVDMETDVPQVYGSDDLTVVPQGAFTLIGLTVENTGSKPQRYFAEYVTAIAGDEIPSDYAATLFANEQNEDWITEVAPGEEIPTIVVFDTNEPLTAVVLREDADSSGVTVEL